MLAKAKLLLSPKDISKTLLGLLIIGTLSLAMMFSSIYLLDTYKNKIEQTKNTIAEFQTLQEDYASFKKLADIYHSTEFVAFQLGMEANFINEIKMKKDIPELKAFDSPFVNIAGIWLAETNERFSVAKTSIQGVVFQQNDVFDFKTVQSEMIANIDRNSFLLNKIMYMIVNIDEITVAERNAKITEIDKLVYRQGEDMVSMGTTLAKADERYQAKISTLDSTKEAAERLLLVLRTKYALSITGVVLGFLIFILSLSTFIRRYSKEKL